MDAKYNLLSVWGKNCAAKEKKELDNFSFITEVEMSIARKLAVLSGNLISELETYTDSTLSPKEKLDTLKNIKTAYAALATFVRGRMKYFEPRKVLIMCENKMILAGINPAKIAEEIREVKSEVDKSSSQNSQNSENKEA